MRAYRKGWTEEQKQNNLRMQAKYREKARSEINKRNKEQYKRSPEVQKRLTIKSANNNPERTLWQGARRNAKRHNREFSIDIEDISISEVCPILGYPLKVERGVGYNMKAPSVDRIDSTKGYIKGNVQVISKRANAMKSDASKDELLAFAKFILTYYDE